MARLIDDLVRFGFPSGLEAAKKHWRREGRPDWEGLAEFNETKWLPWTRLPLSNLLARSIAIEVDDVAEMLIQKHGHNSRDFRASDFPSVVPPFDVCFVEFRKSPYRFKREGYLVMRLEDRERAALAIHFLERDGLETPGQATQWEWTEDGRILPPITYMAPFEGCDLASEEGDFLNAGLGVVLTAFSLLSCKNVSLRDALIPPKLDHSRIKKCGIPLVRYKVLDVMPFRKAISIAESAPGTAPTIVKALHICRGHFKDYRQHGLFGKSKGVFWWEPSVRGDAGSGVVVKDYKLKMKNH